MTAFCIKIVKDPHMKCNIEMVNALVKLVLIYEELQVDFKSEIFSKMNSSTSVMINEMVSRSNRLVPIKSLAHVEEYKLSKVKKTSTSQFLHMMKSVVASNS